MGTAWVDMLGGCIQYHHANGIKTRCLEAGSGDPLLLLHGGGGHAETWVRNVVPLSGRFHVYAIDMIGHGLSDQPDDVDYTIRDFVDHAFSFLDGVGAKTAHVVGQSFGGWVGAWMAIQRPERVRRLGMVASAGLKVVEEGVKSSLKKTGFDAIEKPNLDTMRKRLEHLFYTPDHLTDELVEIRLRLYERALGRSSLRKVMEQTMGEAQTDYLLTPERLRKISAPTLFVWGERNPVTPPEVAEKAAREVPRAEFVLMEKCGRWPQFESPDLFNRKLTEFLIAG